MAVARRAHVGLAFGVPLRPTRMQAQPQGNHPCKSAFDGGLLTQTESLNEQFAP